MRTVAPALLFLALALAAPSLAAELEGKVVDAATGVPVGGATVRLLPGGAPVTTGPDGAFRVALPAAGVAALAVSRPGYEVSRLEVGPTTRAVTVQLAPVISVADRIEVTASRAREGADAASFTNLPRERIQEAYQGQDPAMLLAETVPGFFAYNDGGAGIGYSYFTVRGFSQARTRVTINGAPLNDAESGELFFVDLANFLATAGDIQLWRGVHGLSGIGGALDVTTEAPDMAPAFELSGAAGSYGTSRLSARYASGLVEGRWALSAAYSKVKTDGYRELSWVDQWSTFLSLARFGERSRLRLVLFGGPEETHLAYEGVPRSVLDGGLTGDRDRDRRANPIAWPGEVDSFTQPHYQLLHEVELGTSTTLSQTLYAFRGDGSYEQLRLNRRLSEYDLPEVTLPDGTVVTRSDLVRRRSVGEWDYGWVPTLSHTAGPWRLTVSGEARLHQAHHTGEVRWARHYPEGVAPDHRYYDYRVGKRSASAAVQASCRVTPRLTLSAGLQVASHRYRLSDDRLKGVAFAERYTFTLPRAGAVLSLRQGLDAYASVARGMREPAFRQLYDPQDPYGTRTRLDAEDVWDWESGVSLRRGSWRLRANLFHMAFANEIVYAGALDDNGVPVYGNGARSRHRGVELDGSLELSPALGLDLAASWSRNTFTRYRERWDEQTTVVYDGNRIAGYPDVMAQLSLRATAGPVRLRLAGRHAGRFFVDNTEDNRRDPAARQEPGYVARVNDAYTVVDLAAFLELSEGVVRPLGLSRLGLELRVNNLLDRRYTAFGYLDNEPLYIPAATRNASLQLTLGL